MTYQNDSISINGKPLSQRPYDLQDHWDKSERDYANDSEPVDLEAMADEMALLRKDMNDMLIDVRFQLADYMVYDINHRLETLERQLRA